MPRNHNSLDFKLTPAKERKLRKAGAAQLGPKTAGQYIGIKGVTFMNWLYGDCRRETSLCKVKCEQWQGHEAARIYKQAFIDSQMADKLTLSPAQRLNHSQYPKSIIESEGDMGEAQAVMGAERQARAQLDDELAKLTAGVGALASALADEVGDGE